MPDYSNTKIYIKIWSNCGDKIYVGAPPYRRIVMDTP